jgi:outer membrane biosynthesis protein TonB
MASVHRSRRDGAPIIWFLLFSLFLNVAAAVAGWWIHLPTTSTPIMLTEADMNDAPPLGSPDAPEEQPPTDPQPTPPPEPEPTPPPLDKPPEFELPEPTPTPAPPPVQPQPTPKPKTEKPKASPNPNAAATPGQQKGFANGVVGGTGNGGPRSGLFVRSPKPPYPPQALQLHISGNVSAVITVSNGTITGVHANGPSMLASAAERWVRSNWQAAPTTNGSFTLPINFVIAH